MYKLQIPPNYKNTMSLRETEKAIKFIKDTFEGVFAKALNLERISAPLFVAQTSGLNDDLNGVERAVCFDIKTTAEQAVIVHSLAKWKRMALNTYKFGHGEGIYTDMNAIRRDDQVDNIHSIYVDQWDWELIINKEERTLDFLKATVRKIVCAMCDTLDALEKKYPAVKSKLERNVFFINSQELEDLYPALNPKERELAIAKKHKTVFIMQIGDILSSGIKHDGRAPDYDDWSLNGDLFFYNEVLGEQLELSSMGIRVDSQALREQLKKANAQDRMKFNYHKMLLNGELPLTIGGGIGQSRMCMLMLQKMHIGEVQVSLWPEEMLEVCRSKDINIL